MQKLLTQQTNQENARHKRTMINASYYVSRQRALDEGDRYGKDITDDTKQTL